MLLSLRTLFTPAAVLLLATGSAFDEFGFHAEEGSRVVRTFEFEFEMELDSMSMTLGGNDVPNDHIAGMEMSVGQSSHIVVTDEYGAAEGGRPLSLTRTYDELIGESSSSSSGPGGESDNDLDYSSALEGNTVVFTWDADAEEYDVEFAEDGDEELLAGLEEDMDLRGFLPDGEVAEGESWEADIEPFRRVIQAGGNVHFESDEDELAELSEQLRENLDGDVRVTYAGSRDEDGVTVAVLQLEVSATTNAAVTVPRGEEQAEQTVAMELELEGELYWDLEAGRLHGLALSGKQSSEVVNTSDFSHGADPMELVQTMLFDGEIKFEVTVEAE